MTEEQDKKDRARYALIADGIVSALMNCGNEVEQNTVIAAAVRRIDVRARIDEDEALLARLGENEFKCNCRSGSHPKSCPNGWARQARTVLEDRIAMMHQALEEPRLEQP